MSKESVEDLEAALRYVKDEDLLSVLLEMLVERPVSSGHATKRDVLLEAIHAARQLKESFRQASSPDQSI